MDSPLLKNLIPILMGLAIFLLAFSYYDKFEKSVLRRFRNRFEWIEKTLARLFLRHDQKLVTMISYLPAISISLLFLFTGVLFGYPLFLTVIVTVLLLIFSWFLPIIVLAILYKVRLKRFDTQLTDALNLMGSSLKAGLSFLQAIQIMIDEMANPLSQEFKVLLAEHRLGSSIEEAFQNMVKRIPSRDLEILVNSIVILRETGGDLTETFDTLYTTIMGRRKVEGKISAMTSMGIAQGTVLSSLPVLLGLGFYFFQPEYMSRMVTTPVGLGMTLGMFVLIAIGIFAIMRVTKIDV